MNETEPLSSEPAPRENTPQKQNRRWIPTRLCGCGMCRFFPASSRCPSPENAVQLYVSEPW